jgi:predicted phage terminase large subunit-like protein
MYDCYIRKAVENGTPIFSDIVCTDKEKEESVKNGKDVESLETLKRVMSPLFFSGQIMNDPLADELVEFKREWILKFERTPELMKMLMESPKVVSVDPAFRLNQTNDFSGLTVVARGKDGFIYVMEAKQIKVNPSQLIDEIFRLVEMYKPMKVLVETVAAQVMLLDLLRNKMRDLSKFFTIEETKSSTNETKTMRIRGLIPFYANGQILHAQGLADLEEQLLEFPRGIHDDIIDALAAHQHDWKVIKTQVQRKKEEPYTWNWWSKQPIMGSKRSSSMKQLFGDLLPHTLGD